jgi:hypothetical protein
MTDRNQITVGAIDTPNPQLWVNATSLDKPPAEYKIASLSPGPEWVPVNQFCSLLSIQWLLHGQPSSYRISNFPDSEKIDMALELIAFSSLQAQEEAAAEQLSGSRQFLNQTAEGVQGKYKIGTKIWAGNNTHAVAIYLTSETEYKLYDPNTGSTTQHQRSQFGGDMTHLNFNAFVVKQN